MMTRTDRRRFPILLAAIAALAMAMLFSPVQAQEVSAPDQPSGLEATATHEQVTLTWDDPQDDSITGYVILRRVRVNDTGGDFDVMVADTASAATTYTDDTVAASLTYTYRIKPINEHGVSERSRWFHIDIPAAPEEEAAEPPAKPTGLSATATHDQVVLTWDDPNDDSITGYVILRRIPGVDPEGQFSELVSTTGTDATTYTDDTVSAETRYTYRIKAINEHGVSERSRWSHINVPAAPEAVEGDDPDGEDDDGAPGGPGKRANVSEPDGEDLPSDDTTTGEVDVGGSVTGNIGTGTDGDWFKVVLEAGTRYQIDLEGADTSRGTLPDPRMGLYDSDALVGSFSNDEGVGKNARRIYTPTAGGAYYVRTQNPNGSDTGTYTLSVIVLGANGASEADTDFPATTGRVDVGASVTGTISTPSDSDLFDVDLEAGKTYQFDLEGADSGRGTLVDPYLSLFDGSATFLLADDDSGTNLNSQMVYNAASAGAHYLRATTGAANFTGTYTLSVRDITPCTLNTGDIWCGVVTVGELNSSANVLVGHGFAGGPSLSAGGLAGNPDDTMFSVGDNDYTISGVYIQVPTGANLTGTLFVVLDKDLTEDDKAGLVFTVDDTTTFAFSAASKGGTTGLYSWGRSGLDWSSTTTVTVRLSGPPPDDFSADTTTTGQVDVGGSVTGNIESVGDGDWFLVELEAGTRY